MYSLKIEFLLNNQGTYSWKGVNFCSSFGEEIGFRVKKSVLTNKKEKRLQFDYKDGVLGKFEEHNNAPILLIVQLQNGSLEQLKKPSTCTRTMFLDFTLA